MDGYVGEIRLFSFHFAPKGWHLCDGSQLPIKTNEVLFSLLGTRYGGDGASTFALPERSDPEGSYCIAVRGLFPVE